MKDYGFQPDIITPDHYTLLGAQLPFEELQPDGQWDADLPVFEPQSSSFESYDCTGFGTNNCIETILLKKKISQNISDRAVGILAGTGKTNGNSPHIVAETIRKNGCIPESSLPFDDKITTREAFYSPDPLPQELLAQGIKWLDEFDFGHDWVFATSDLVNQSVENKIKLMKSALKSSPLGISVYAWVGQDGFFSKPAGFTDNHWCMCYGWNDKGWKVYDSYDGGFKIYSFDSDITFAKRYVVNIKKVSSSVNLGQNRSFLYTLFVFIKKILGI